MKMYNRKSIRLKGYDYSKNGFYYITIKSYESKHYFGIISNQEMILNNAGKMIKKWYLKLETKFNVKCHKYIIMPNHIHFIIEIKNDILLNPQPVGAIPCNRPKHDKHDKCNCPKHGKCNRPKHGKCNRPKHGKCNRPKHGKCNCPKYGKFEGENMVSPLQIDNEYKYKWDYDGLGRYVSWFKRMVTNEYIKNVKLGIWEPFYKKIWQRGYYEHIVRDYDDYLRIVDYIKNNPKKWN